jgi:hypothetical protein
MRLLLRKKGMLPTTLSSLSQPTYYTALARYGRVRARNIETLCQNLWHAIFRQIETVSASPTVNLEQALFGQLNVSSTLWSGARSTRSSRLLFVVCNELLIGISDVNG